MKKHFCYILRNRFEPHINRTYNGYTVDLKKRLRQHNQEIKGGAKYTKSFGNKTWEYIAYIEGIPNYKNALQCEWRIKHPDNKRRRSKKYCSPEGRIKGLNLVLKTNKWTNNSVIENKDMQLTVNILKEYVHLLDNIPDNIKVNSVEKIEFE